MDFEGSILQVAMEVLFHGLDVCWGGGERGVRVAKGAPCSKIPEWIISIITLTG